MRTERGQSTVELVLLTPLLLVLVFLIFEFGRVFGSWLIVTNAAREGARFAVTQTWCAPGTACPSDQAIIDRVAQTAQWLSPGLQTTTPCAVSGTAPGGSVALPGGAASCVAVVRYVDGSTQDHVVQVFALYRVQTLMPISGAIPFLGPINYPAALSVAGLSSMRSAQ